MVPAVLVLRFVKIVGVLLLVAGTLGAVLPSAMPLATRRRFAFAVAAPGLLVTWTAGFLLAYFAGHRLWSTWVVLSMFLSLVSIQGVLYSAGRDGRASWRVVLFTLSTLLGIVALMVWRPA
jgi:4-amino-4-deoxy-L-arabinose transferase-like glycosyltransferase